MKTSLLVLAIGAALAASPLASFADDKYNQPGTTKKSPDTMRADEPAARARMDQRATTSAEAQLVASATNTYKSITESSQGSVPRTVLDKAKCVAVFPEIVAAAAVIGGSRGSGIASCKVNNSWSKPAFLKLTSGSIGAKIGATSSSAVYFFMTDEAVNRLKTGDFTLGADATAVAGSYDTRWDSGTANVVSYERSKGGMLGASVAGYSLSRDDTMNRNYYGKNADYMALLNNTADVPTMRESDQFISALPKTM